MFCSCAPPPSLLSEDLMLSATFFNGLRLPVDELVPVGLFKPVNTLFPPVLLNVVVGEMELVSEESTGRLPSSSTGSVTNLVGSNRWAFAVSPPLVNPVCTEPGTSPRLLMDEKGVIG